MTEPLVTEDPIETGTPFVEGNAAPTHDHPTPAPAARGERASWVQAPPRSVPAPAAALASITRRVDALPWPDLWAELDDLGCALSTPVLSPAECREVADLYGDDARFRSTVDMARHRFGQGQYRYFAYPLPPQVAELRTALWPHLLPVAREWADRLGRRAPWPDDLDDWLAQCHRAGQTRPTPLLLRYGPGDWNALHRDLYGDLVFPLQVVIGLDEPGVDHQGGEFVIVEQRPRAQSRATTTVIGAGQGLIVTTNDRPVRSARGWTASPVRHGVSVLRRGRRRTLGLVFHDAT
jgi:hypothetical protein